MPAASWEGYERGFVRMSLLPSHQMEASPSPLSSRAKPRDLPFVQPACDANGSAALYPLSSREPVTFSIFRVFCTRNRMFSTPRKTVILSEAPRGSIPYQTAYGAESKDPSDACWQMLFQAFQPRTTSQIKKVTSSERSASQMDRVTQGLVARSRRTPTLLTCPCCSELFNHRRPSPDLRVSFEDYEDI